MAFDELERASKRLERELSLAALALQFDLIRAARSYERKIEDAAMAYEEAMLAAVSPGDLGGLARSAVSIAGREEKGKHEDCQPSGRRERS